MQNRLEIVGSVLSATLLCSGLAMATPLLPAIQSNFPQVTREIITLGAGAISLVGVAMLGLNWLVKK